MAAMDDLDDLLNDLERSKGSTAGAPPQAAPQSRRPNSNALELDELNDLMNDLGAASAKPAAKPAPAPAPASSTSSQRGTTVRRDIVSADMNKSMEDLDALMDSLNTADNARASTAAPAIPRAAAKPAGGSSRASVQTEDLDALMASLDNPRGSVAPKAAAKPAPAPQSRPVSGVPSAGDDLDALMADLDGPRKSTAAAAKPAPAPAQPQSRPVSKAPGGDDLDALMADLESSNARRSTAPVAAAPAPKPAPKAAAKPPPGDDLDALMADLDGPRKSTAAAPAGKAASRPVSGMGGADDLDALLADLDGGGRSRPVSGVPAAKPAPVAAAPKAAPFVAAAPAKKPAPPAGDMEELDALMGSLNSDRRSVAPKAAAKPAAGGGEDLDSLMSSLGQPAAQKPVTYTPTVTHQPPPKPAAKKPAGAAPAGGDDISKLMNSLASQVADAGDGSSVSKGMCAYCKKQILGEVVSAIGKVFHVDHWICQNCQEPLGTKTFFELDGAPYCEKCYSSTYCVKCGYCDEPILDRCITAIGKKWHINHFICTQCLQPFPRGVFYERDGKPYCETDFFEVYCPKCAACDKPIRGDCVNALGQQWHQEHWGCTFCKKAFGSEPFFEIGGKPYCEQHYHQQSGALCQGCKKPIQGRCITALDKKWHPEHFTCAFCMNPLAGASYVEKQGKPYCKTCNQKLFS